MPAVRTPPLTLGPPVHAAAHWQAIEFVSDLHLCDKQPATFDRWGQYMRSTDADAVFILGDLFEVWIGDDACVPGSFASAAAQVLSEAATRRTVGFMAGNRDFLVGPAWLQRCGLLALPDPMVLQAWDRNVLLSHGDALCLDDLAYQDFRAEVRCADWQERFLARPLEERARLARGMRDASEVAKRQRAAEDYADVVPAAALDWLEASGCQDLVHGHTHRPGTHELATGHRRHVLSDWDFDTSPVRGQVLRLTRAGFARIDLRP